MGFALSASAHYLQRCTAVYAVPSFMLASPAVAASQMHTRTHTIVASTSCSHAHHARAGREAQASFLRRWRERPLRMQALSGV